MRVTTHRPPAPSHVWVVEYQRFENFPQPIACQPGTGLIWSDGTLNAADQGDDGVPTLADHLCYLVTMNHGSQYRANSTGLFALLRRCGQDWIEADERGD